MGQTAYRGQDLESSMLGKYNFDVSCQAHVVYFKNLNPRRRLTSIRPSILSKAHSQVEIRIINNPSCSYLMPAAPERHCAGQCHYSPERPCPCFQEHRPLYLI